MSLQTVLLGTTLTRTIVIYWLIKVPQLRPSYPNTGLREILKLILRENSFQFNWKNNLQTHGTEIDTKMAVAFANVFMADIAKTKITNRSSRKPFEWKRFIDDIFSLWDITKQEIESSIAWANRFHPAIKFTAEISDKEITFLDTTIYKEERFADESMLDVRTHFKLTETFQYTQYTSCHPPGVKRGARGSFSASKNKLFED